MEVENIVQLFANLGVPVACLVAVFALWNKEREDHKAEMNSVTQAINNNTTLLQRLLDKLNG